MLKEIAIITIAVANPAQVERAWNAELGYTTVDNGAVSTQLAQLWNAPDMVGDTFITMAPANSAQTFVRLVQDDSAGNYAAMTSHGWNATELLVRDTDAVAARLRESDADTQPTVHELWETLQEIRHIVGVARALIRQLQSHALSRIRSEGQEAVLDGKESDAFHL